MKREGRQHGVVRTYPVLEATPLSQQRYVKNNMVDPAMVTGMFTKASGKPTNQSKFTGKCGTARCSECHIHPATKAKDKAKGTMKVRSIEESDPELVSCGAGASATCAHAYLAGVGSYDNHDECEGENDVDENDYDSDSDTTFNEDEELGTVSEEPIRVARYCDAQESEDNELCLVE